MIYRSHASFFFFKKKSHHQRERERRELKDSLGERVNLEGQPHYFREKLSVMDLSTFQHNYVIDFL